MSEASGRFEIKNRLGLHARAATKLVQTATRFAREGQVANAKSVMGVLLLCGSKGSEVEVEATGEGAEQAVAAIGRLIDDLFGEGE